MTGTHSCKLDDKGRLSVPARLRDDLGETFYVTLWREPCLVAHTQESWDKLMSKFKAMSAKEQSRMRPLFSNATKCEPDGQGRILLPPALRDFAGLKKNVTVIGMAERTEFWDSEAWEALNKKATTPESIEQMFTDLGI